MNNANGSVFKYPDNVDTDVIIPARHLNTQDAKELASHCMEDIDKDFVKNVKDGDIMVGGWNFGCGSSREHAPLCIKTAGIAVVIAKYFSESGSAKLNYANKPFLFSIGGLELSIFVPLGIILLIISYVVLYKTRFGLRLRACGEHPQAADSVGINVYKMRYAGACLLYTSPSPRD